MGTTHPAPRPRPAHHFRRALAALLLAGAAFGTSLPVAAAEPSKADKIKAAYLYNFTKFIRWPDTAFGSADQPILLCAYSDDAFQGFLAAVVRGRTGAQQRTVTVVHNPSGDAVADCHLVYYQRVPPARLAPGCQCVLVGDDVHFRRYGTTMNFFVDDRRLRFEVLMAQLNGRGITLSAELLKLARTITTPVPVVGAPASAGSGSPAPARG